MSKFEYEVIDFKKKESEEVIEKKTGTLYLVSTPIGNKEDITLRAIRVLRDCHLVVCEEYKQGARLMKQYQIPGDIDTLNEQNEEEKCSEIITKLKEGLDIGLISDAGTPVFEDPGAILVRRVLDEKLPITVVPGASSIMTALVRSGFQMHQFYFAGFLSRKPEERLKQMALIASKECTVALLETPYRLLPILEAASKIMPERKAYIGMNLTLPYETHYYGNFKDLYQKFSEKKMKGEFVICFEGAGKGFEFDTKRLEDEEFYRPRSNDRRGRPSYSKSGSGYRKDDRRSGYDRNKKWDKKSSYDKPFKSKYNKDERKSDSGKSFDPNAPKKWDRNSGGKKWDRKSDGKKWDRNSGGKKFGRKPSGKKF